MLSVAEVFQSRRITTGVLSWSDPTVESVIYCHTCARKKPIFHSRMHQIAFGGWGSLQRSPGPLVVLMKGQGKGRKGDRNRRG